MDCIDKMTCRVKRPRKSLPPMLRYTAVALCVALILEALSCAIAPARCARNGQVLMLCFAKDLAKL